jgi:hypothetical protein
VSEVLTRDAAADKPRPARRRPALPTHARPYVWAAGALLLLALPFYLDRFDPERDTESGQIPCNLLQAIQHESVLLHVSIRDVRIQHEEDNEGQLSINRITLGLEQGEVVTDSLITGHDINDAMAFLR